MGITIRVGDRVEHVHREITAAIVLKAIQWMKGARYEHTERLTLAIGGHGPRFTYSDLEHLDTVRQCEAFIAEQVNLPKRRKS